LLLIATAAVVHHLMARTALILAGLSYGTLA
jgi:hypothetical protein